MLNSGLWPRWCTDKQQKGIRPSKQEGNPAEGNALVSRKQCPVFIVVTDCQNFQCNMFFLYLFIYFFLCVCSSCSLYPGDLYPFTRKPFFIIVDSDNSFVFQHVPRYFGQPLVILMSPQDIPPAFQGTPKTLVFSYVPYLSRYTQRIFL